MKLNLIIALTVYFAVQALLLWSMNSDYSHLSIWNVVRPAAILTCAILFLKTNKRKYALLAAIWAASGLIRIVITPPLEKIGYLEGVAELVVFVAAYLASRPRCIKSDRDDS